MKNLGSLLRNITTYTLYVTAGLVPLFFLPITVEFFDTNKQFLVFLSAFVLTVCFAVYGVLRKTVRITLSPALIAVVVYAISLLISTFMATPYSYEVLLGRGLLILALTFLFIAGSSLGKAQTGTPFLYVLSGSAVALSVLSLLQNVGWGPSHLLNMIPGLEVPHNALFNMAGSALIAVLFLVPVFLANLVELFAVSDSKKKAVHGIITAVIALGIVVNGYFMLPGRLAQPVFIPFQTSWSIAIDTLKNPRTALIGVGPESYVVAFTAFRPANLNLSEFWNVRFPGARIEPLHILTTMGIVGLAAWALMAFITVQLSFPLSSETRPLSVVLITLLVAQLLFPASLVLIALFYLTLVMLVLVRKAQRDSRTSDVLLQLSAVKVVRPETNEKVEKSATGILAYVVAGVIAVASLFSVYQVGNAYASEVMFYQSLLALQGNDILRGHQLQQTVVDRNLYSDRYHRAFSTTNFAIASAIAENPDATEDQRANIAPLIQEAVRQAKIATELDPRKAVNWENLAAIYRSLIGSVQEAEEFTIAALVRTIQSDPTNPALRFELANVYASVDNHEQAVRLFQQTIELKPDWANAYYNLANSYRQKGDLAFALEALLQTQQLIPEGTEDRTVLDKEIADLRAQVEAATPATGTSQQAAGDQTASQTPLAEEQIRLPEDLGLPQATPPSTIPETPEQSPTPTPANEGAGQ